ncbi:MAG: 4Fe-4S binding protein [Deltaproteobacteria bacterium]|nr:4Fe-4S binding protein [Deltaproteobacteria bacterium]
MKIAITASGPTLDDQVEVRFGRAPYYLIADSETMEYETVANPNVAAGGGAGIQSAQLMSDRGVKAILTGNCGPNAFRVFASAGIEIIVGVSGIVSEAIEQFKSGNLRAAASPNVESHFGMGGGRGTGGGRGMGMGGDRGMGMASGKIGFPGVAPRPDASVKDDSNALKEEARLLEEQLQDVKRRIEQAQDLVQGKGESLAYIDPGKCNGCGACVDYCPVDAIIMCDVAAIDKQKCTGCELCIDKCPLDAITMI